MKRLSAITLVPMLVFILAIPVSAFENIFGGYWRTRAFTQQQFTGDNRDESRDLSRVDTRTRLFYTAKINDRLAFHNKFEFNAVWGDNDLGSIGADGDVFSIKNSYVDFDIGSATFKVGIQNFNLDRGFTFDDDASGLKVIWKVAEGIYFPIAWLRAAEGYENIAENEETAEKDFNNANDGDIDTYTVAPLIYLSQRISVNPTMSFVHSREARSLALDLGGVSLPAGFVDDVNFLIFGMNADANFDRGTLWITGVLQRGDFDLIDPATGRKNEINFKGWIAGIGGNMDVGSVDFHGQVLYASGDDDLFMDGDLDAFYPTPGASYYWAEIMGLGMFDNEASAGSPGDKLSNIQAYNIGVTVKPIAKFKITLDAWYASLNEDDLNGEDELGTELDLKLTYQLVRGLNLDVVGAYLFAGKATGDDDPLEVGTRLSISF